MAENTRGKLVVVSGPSGVGKSTLLARVLRRAEVPLVMSVSATTRPPRPGERNGVDYHFLSAEAFAELRRRNEFLECFEVFGKGDWYGTLNSEVAPRLDEGKWVVLEIDVKGAGQLQAIQAAWGDCQPIELQQLLLLPGVVNEDPQGTVNIDEDWPLIEETVTRALDGLEAMRREEGAAMAADLAANLEVIRSSLDEVEKRTPLVVDAYRNRLNERIGRVLAELNATLEPADILKEVSLFADRSDISEEIVRLRSHVEQFGQIMDSPEPSGRKLEFLTQEMVREGNTIGSKANDLEIARQVIEIKAALERIREMIQNVE